MAQDASPAGAAPLPCPFCGVDAVRVVRGHAHLWRQTRCLSCGATAAEARIFLTHTGNAGDAEADAIRRALAAWNTRPAAA